MLDRVGEDELPAVADRYERGVVVLAGGADLLRHLGRTRLTVRFRVRKRTTPATVLHHLLQISKIKIHQSRTHHHPPIRHESVHEDIIECIKGLFQSGILPHAGHYTARA